MVERVGDDRIGFAEQWLEQAAVGVEAGGVKDGVLGAEELGDARFQLLVQVLGAADEAYRGHAEAMGVQRVLGRGDQRRVVGQAQVVVGAEVEHAAAVGQHDLRRLRADDDALGLEQALRADRIQCVGVVLGEAGIGHDGHAQAKEAKILTRHVRRSAGVMHKWHQYRRRSHFTARMRLRSMAHWPWSHGRTARASTHLPEIRPCPASCRADSARCSRSYCARSPAALPRATCSCSMCPTIPRASCTVTTTPPSSSTGSRPTAATRSAWRTRTAVPASRRARSSTGSRPTW